MTPGADQARSIGGGQGWPTTFYYDQVRQHFAIVIGAGGAVLIAMGILVWTGELFQLNIQAQHLLDRLGLDFFNAV
jgi:hypothetical protein